MATSISYVEEAASDAPLLSNREALARLINYARVEAEREGETACADLLFAAFLALEAPLTQTELWATVSGLGQRRPC